MVSKFVRAPNGAVLIAGGIALLSLAVRGAWTAVANPNHIPILVVHLAVIGGARNAILGAALLFIAARRSQFAGATAVVVATFLVFDVVLTRVMSLAFGLSAPLTWSTAIYLAIAASIIGPSLFPWNSTANKPVLFWMGLTIAALVIFAGSLALLARL
ncbi:MAG: hypothetical protein V4499_07845 [Pseudomonadota bacterium]